MYVEENEESFLRNLSLVYKEIIHQDYKKRVLLSKTHNIPENIIIKGYIDDTSIMVYRNEKELDIMILEIPKSFYNYFIGKSGVMKIKHEKVFNISIEEISDQKIKVDGEGKYKFKKYVLDKIYNHII
ncbi:uncharacterized protein VNE69_01370 [Vairimorpha necatrix]|uniref:Uncharacterized protein n=1 Tax=Vairimorpha necatrix TaxID=6039 RepID=A0AAX4J907_9MICR